MDKKTLIAAALKVAKNYPVFPTNDKRPVWSNAELGLEKGQGGYKIATQDPDLIRKYFNHPRATEIAVPMGERSGLICIDVDTYKDNDLQGWLETNADEHDMWHTLVHETRSVGTHFIYLWPGKGHRFPATLREGVDLKGEGGFICWPPTEGYSAINKNKPKELPLALIEQCLKEKGGTGTTKLSESFNSTPDDDLVEAILEARDFYPALRTLSYRMVGRGVKRADAIETLERVMDDSVASGGNHPRFDDWIDRRGKIEDLVDSAIKKQTIADFHDDELAGIHNGPPIMEVSRARPIGPQRETTEGDILRRVAEKNLETSDADQADEASGYIVTSEGGLLEERIDPLEWLIPQTIPVASIVSLAGTSNVGKTRIICALITAIAAGDTERMGLPAMEKRATALYYANEERGDDIRRRLKACAIQHGSGSDTPIIIRGKDHGMLRLVAVNEVGTLELDEENIVNIIAEALKHCVAMIIFDPYVTLADGDENSADAAKMLTKALLIITNVTGAVCFHAHHTPKDRSKDEDWCRGSSDAWRGSGAIFSGLDCGFTLTHWLPKNREQRKKWKQHYIDNNLSRWIVLDSGKVREGRDIKPVIFELVGQEMHEGEGDEIGVCRLADQHQAENSMLHSNVDTLGAEELARALLHSMGFGTFSKSEVHKEMRGHPLWENVVKLTDKHMARFEDWYGIAISVEAGTVQLDHDPEAPTNGRWTFVLEENDDG